VSTAEATKTRKQLGEEARALAERAQAIQAKGDDATPEEMTEAAKAFVDATAIRDRLAASAKGMPAADALTNILDGLNTEHNPPPACGRVIGREDAREAVEATKSIGELIVEAEAFKSWRPGVRQEVAFAIPGYRINTGIKATFLTTGLTGYDRQPGVVQLEQQRLTIADLLSQARTTQPTIRYWRENTYTNAATTVAEEGEKPEATFDVVETDAPVRKVAVVAKVSDETREDFPSIADYINERLRFMVGEREDRQIYSGNGTSPNIRGITATTGIQTEASASAADNLDAIHRAVTKVRSVGFFEPDGIVMHPTDYQKIRLAKDANGQYFGGGPFYNPYGNGPLGGMVGPWGLTPVVTTAATVGTALVGAFRLGATLFRRQGLMVEMTNSNEDDFVFNRITIRAEERIALAVWRPLAFCTVTGIA
jgi:HK97 family phage major capsid protein